MELKYFMPTKVVMGKDIVKNSARELKSFGNKALIVTGRSSSKRNGSLDDVIKALESEKIEYTIFNEIEENPSVETVERAATKGKENKVDFIIGIGGGSPIDASKAIGVMIKNQEVTAETLFTDKELESIDIVAIPTTAGTGTETTQYSILTDHKAKTKRNLGQSIFPKLSLLDPSYMMEMPVGVTKNTAVDALSHIIEGYLNSNASLITDGLCEKALAIWGETIDALLKEEFSYEIREKLMIASTMAGIIIAQNGTSLPHGMGYNLTYFKDVPHGLANGCLYVEYLKVFKNREKVNKIVELLGLKSMEELEKVLRALTTIKIDITKEEIKEYSKVMAANKWKLKNHPEEIGFDEIYNIYYKSLF